MAHVQVDRVISEKTPFEPQGKSYKIYEFICEGYIDGNAASNFTVKTLSGKARTHVQPGFEFDAEVDNYNGRVAYKIPRWMYAQGGPLANALHGGTSYNAPQQNYQPPQQNYQQPAQRPPQQQAYQYPDPRQQQAPRPAQPRTPSGNDVLNMYCTIFDTLKHRYIDIDDQVAAAMSATILIQCGHRKVDVPVAAPPRQQSQPQQQPPQRPAQQVPPEDDFPPDGDMSYGDEDVLDDNLPF